MGVGQNGQTPIIIGICSYCVLDRPLFERCQTLLHPELIPWWSFLLADGAHHRACMGCLPRRVGTPYMHSTASWRCDLEASVQKRHHEGSWWRFRTDASRSQRQYRTWLFFFTKAFHHGLVHTSTIINLHKLSGQTETVMLVPSCNLLSPRAIGSVKFVTPVMCKSIHLQAILTSSLYSHISWWRHQMETFSMLLAICAGNSPVTGELPAQRPVTRSFDVFLDLRLNERLSKQSLGWWFETPSRTLWDVTVMMLGSLWRFNWNIPGEFGEYHCHSWTGSLHRQVIRSYGIDYAKQRVPVVPEDVFWLSVPSQCWSEMIKMQMYVYGS